MDLKHNVNWQVSLSNGETFFEGKGKFREIRGELSPWQKLIRYTIEKQATITSLSLYTKDGRTFNLPSAGKNPRFREFTNIEPPIDYEVCRKIAREIDVVSQKVADIKISDWFTVAIAFYPWGQLQLWVDEKNTRNCWVRTALTGD